MSLRSFLKFNRLSVASALILGVGVCDLAFAASAGTLTNVPPVQVYADQAAPSANAQSQGYYDSPLAAGTLTLQDVLEAHKPLDKGSRLPAINGGSGPAPSAAAPVLAAPSQASTTGLMLSQGMKDVLQKVGMPTVPPTQVRPPVGATAQQPAQGQPTALVPDTTSAAASVSPAGIPYEPGQEPKNLATGAPESAVPVATSTAAAAAAQTASSTASVTPASSAPSAPVASSASSSSPTAKSDDKSCNQNPQKWEKSCAEAGYPATYLGKIVGETRTGCSDGALHDVWVTNTCAPADVVPSQITKTDGSCGVASNQEFDDTPTSNLCAQGIASTVSGSGPWTWACSGVNGGDAAACTAPLRVAAVNGICGSANGSTTASMPSSDDLCNKGNASSVKGQGPWTWSCKGIGKGSSQSCIAQMSASASSSTPQILPTPVEDNSSKTVPATAAVSPSAATAAAPLEEGALCGSASETLAYEAPQKDLCRSGTASMVNGDGPWTWSCTNNEGVTSSCRTLSLSGNTSSSEPAPALAPAPQAAPALAAEKTDLTPSHPKENILVPPVPQVELACGIASSQSTMMAPSTELCQGGKASVVRGANPWRWTCSHGRAKISCETPKTLDGACGAANGTALKSAPFSGLCASGAPSAIDGNGPWNWACNGSGGGLTVSCAASVESSQTDKTDGVCGTSDNSNANEAPTNGLCSAGIPSAVSGSGPWTWSCSGSNGGAVGSCSAKKIVMPKAPGPSVNGQCGAASGVMVSAQPVDGLCASGTLSGVVGTGPWNWSCLGDNGGMTVSCTAPLEPPAPIDGVCGAANGVPTLVKPQSGLCSSGITGSVNGRGPWTWTCSGANGGVPAACVAAVAGKSGAMPSTMTSAGVDVDGAAPSAAPVGLVTPRLPASGDLSSLDKQTLPSLTSSKAFAKAPKPSHVPAPPALSDGGVTGDTPSLPEGSEGVQPPTVGQHIPSASVLQEAEDERATRTPGNHLTLDPTISTILFARASGNTDNAAVNTMDKLVSILQANPDVRISLIAYADNSGSTPRDARKLSLTRALAVRDYISSKGISESRLDIHAEGANTSTGYMDRVDIKVND